MKLNDGIKVEEIENCLLCGAKGFPFHQDMHDQMSNAPGTWGFLNCSKCGLLWLNPLPDINDIERLYTLTYCTHTLNEQKPILAPLRSKIDYTILSEAFGYELIEKRGLRWAGKVFSLIVPYKDVIGAEIMWLNGRQKGKLLDVGCGSGRFLAKMRELGWDVAGVEPDKTAATIAKEHFKLPVHTGRLDEINLPADLFQAVAVRHVIEHVHNPVGLLRECYRLLAPGGVLVILTPNARSLGHNLFSRNWSELDPPRHLFLFSAEALISAAKLADLPAPELVRSTARAARWTWTPSVAIRSTGKSGSQVGLVGALRFVFWAVEESLRFFFGLHCGEELIMIIRKN